jgi:hypothetical protein
MCDELERALHFMRVREEQIHLLFGLKASARKKKDAVWARSGISSVLKEWSGSTLEIVRQGKRGKSTSSWVLRAALASVGSAIGVNRPTHPFTAVTITA